MALVDAAWFEGQETARVYIAGRVSEAQRVERALTAMGVDYFVDKEPYETYLLGVLPVRYEGVAFYVAAGQAGRCRRVLRETGLASGLVEEGLE